MDIVVIKDWATIAAIMLSTILSLYAVFTKTGKQHEEQLSAHELRLQKIEEEVKRLPDTDAVHSIQMSMKDMQIEMATMAAEAQASNRTLRRMEDFLMNKGAAA